MERAELRRAVGENVQARRRELGMTQQTLAQAAGVTQGRISQIEKGEENLSMDRIAELATILRTTPAALLTPNQFSLPISA